MVQCDLVGPISPVSINNSNYAMVFLDDFSSVIFVYVLENESDACATTERFF